MRRRKKEGRGAGGDFYYLIIHVKAMVGDDEPLQACHVGIRRFPSQQERVGLNMAQLQAIDGRQRAQFRVLDGQ